MKRSRKQREAQLETGFNWRAVLAGLAIFAALIVVFYYVYGRRASSSDYEGKILDRWADHPPSTEASHTYFYLLVESATGKRFTVRVDSNVYDSARVGMRVKSRNGQVVLIDSMQNPVSQ